jgi:hypothetical protein
MKNVTCHKGILRVTRKLKHSLNGNPRYEVSIDGYVAKTAPNATLGYTIKNYDGTKVTCHLGLLRNVLTISNVKYA